MRAIDAAAEIHREVEARGVEVVSVDYEIQPGLASVMCRINFAAGPPLVVTVELGRPLTAEELLPHATLTKVLAPLLVVH